MPAAKTLQEPHVVIVGAGFAGLMCVKSLAKAPVNVTLIDKRNHHLFQPLLYQVATAMLSPAQIAAPVRSVLRRQQNARVILGEVTSIDPQRRSLRVGDHEIVYDTLVLATGASHSYFGHEAWAPLAPGLKTVEHALDIRRRLLLAFEAAEASDDKEARRRLLTFLIVGAGPTGVELAGALAEIARRALPRDFRSIDTKAARVVLVEARESVLPAFPRDCSVIALRALRSLGVDVRLNTRVVGVDQDGVDLESGGVRERLACANVLWAAGVKASALAGDLGVELDRSGRVPVGPDLAIPLHPEVFVLGDLAKVVDTRTKSEVPAMAPGAMQMGRYAGKIIASEAVAALEGRTAPAREPFRYIDKGMLAVIGRGSAVAYFRGSAWGGLAAWLLWAVVHIFYLIGFRNRIVTMLDWAWNYTTFRRGARLITGEPDIRSGKNEKPGCDSRFL